MFHNLNLKKTKYIHLRLNERIFSGVREKQ
jgi:hypothetical protein